MISDIKSPMSFPIVFEFRPSGLPEGEVFGTTIHTQPYRSKVHEGRFSWISPLRHLIWATVVYWVFNWMLVMSLKTYKAAFTFNNFMSTTERIIGIYESGIIPWTL